MERQAREREAGEQHLRYPRRLVPSSKQVAEGAVHVREWPRLAHMAALDRVQHSRFGHHLDAPAPGRGSLLPLDLLEVEEEALVHRTRLVKGLAPYRDRGAAHAR